ncbi:TRADD-N-associated membrane domain-containing protein [Streptomyces sp. NPDC001178]
MLSTLVSSDAARNVATVLSRLRKGSEGNGDVLNDEAAEAAIAAKAYIEDASKRAELSETLKAYYEKVARRADVSFYAAAVAAACGLVIIAVGVYLGVESSSDTALAVVTTAAGILSQVTGLFFFRNRTEERSLMASVLNDLREDRGQDVRTLNAIILINQIASAGMKDNLTAAVALQLAGCTVELEKVQAIARAVDEPGGPPQVSDEGGESAPGPS